MIAPRMSARALVSFFPRAARMQQEEGHRWMMCGVLCAMLAVTSPSAGQSGDSDNPCLLADAATGKQIEQLVATKKQRFDIVQPTNLKPWIETVKAESKQARDSTTAALKVCGEDQALGPRARRAAKRRLEKRLRFLDETDQQMRMMKAFEQDPRPKIDPSVIEVLER
jgi:hypothetical protein